MKKRIKLLCCLLIVFVVSSLCGCGGSSESSGSDDNGENKNASEKEYVSEEDFQQMFSSPDDFSGKYVKITGKVFSIIDQDSDETHFMAFNDPDDVNQGFVVTANSDIQIKEDEYVVVDGKIDGEVKGENVLGGEVSALHVIADSVEESTYIDVASPTIKKLSGDIHQEQYGYSVAITDVEFAEKETRVYVTIKNNGSDTFNFYSFNMKLIQDGKQYEEQMNFNANYQEVQSELLPGTESSGIIAFSPIDPNKSFQIYCEGSSNNWDEKLQPYQFDVPVE